jgi:hypothetical protein
MGEGGASQDGAETAIAIEWRQQERSTMTMVRRFLVVAAAMFWQGGFTFYSAVVVHVGQKVLGSHLEQGLVTQSVTNYLNLAGIAAVVLWIWDIASTRDPAPIRRWLRWALWALLVLTLALLAWLHPRLDALIDVDSGSILETVRFRELHSWYLHVSTVQWAGSLLLTGATLLAWRAEDKRLFAVERTTNS